MLIRFTLSNFLSFKNKVSFSMIPGTYRNRKEHKNSKVKGVSTLKTSVIYGANASGKSNLVKAIAFGRFMVLRGFPSDSYIDYSPYRLDTESLKGDSMLEYEIQAGGKNYAYGFVFNKKDIVEEWLCEITTSAQTVIFSRDNKNREYVFTGLFNKNKSDEERSFIEVIAKSTPDNRLWLHELASKKVKENVNDLEDVLAVFGWFRNSLMVIFPDDKYHLGIQSEIGENKDMQSTFEKLLNYFDTGVDGVAIQDVQLENLPIPAPVVEDIKKELSDSRSENRRSIVTTPQFTFFFAMKDGELVVQKFMTKHQVTGDGTPVYFDTKDESDGTNRIIDFIPLIVDLLKGDNVFVIDEMERSLHPNLIYDIFDLYLSNAANVNSQLIVTTHESNLLSNKLLRKDEIWFVAKTAEGSSLYSLEDYKVKFDENIMRDYLLGRFKGVPSLGDRDMVELKLN